MENNLTHLYTDYEYNIGDKVIGINYKVLTKTINISITNNHGKYVYTIKPLEISTLSSRGHMKHFPPWPNIDSNKFYIYDIETGYPIECSKEERDRHLELFNSFRPKFEGEGLLGMPILVGTGSENMEGDSNIMKDMFHHPENYNIVERKINTAKVYDYFNKEKLDAE